MSDISLPELRVLAEKLGYKLVPILLGSAIIASVITWISIY